MHFAKSLLGLAVLQTTLACFLQAQGKPAEPNWNSWTVAVYQLLGSDSAKGNVHLLMTPLRANWSAADNHGEANLCQMADQLVEPGVFYIPGNLGLYELFQDFALSIAVSKTTASQNAAIDEARKTLQKEASTLKRLDDLTNHEWLRFDELQKTKATADRVSFQRWFIRSEFAARRAAQRAKLAAAEERYHATLPAELSTVAPMIERAVNPENTRSVTTEAEAAITCPVYLTLPSVDAFVSHATPLTVELDHAVHISADVKHQAPQPYTPLLTVDAAEQSQVTQEERIGIRVAFRHVGVIAIQPGPWYSGL
jgi:hypothetical protein